LTSYFMRIHALAIAMIWACAAGSPAAAAIQQRVPAVRCPASDQTETANNQAADAMLTPVDPTLAAQLAYYKAEGSPGVYAPKGWSCLAWNGMSGSILVVTPKRIPPPYYPLPAITGPAVMIQSSDAASSGRFHVAIVTAQLFPLTGSELVTRVRQEHLISDSSFDAGSDPDDQLRYLSDRFVEYTTPANRSGLGTESMFEPSALPIRGLTILHLEPEVDSLIEVRVRLPPGLSAVSGTIMQLEAACVQLSRGCRGLQ
jgi:hypothetical protein